MPESELWKRRFRVPVYLQPQIAHLAPERGIVLSNEAGSHQIYAWNGQNATRQLTQRPDGCRTAALSPDGQWVYYLDDQKGDEIGHWVRLPWEGGAAQDLTPEMPPYASWSFYESVSGNRLGFTAAGEDGFRVMVVDRGTGRSLGMPKTLYHHRKVLEGPFFSRDGTVAVVASAERSAKNHFSLLAFRLPSGERLAELWDGPDTSLEPAVHAFSPVRGDTRILATSDRTGYARPLIWNPLTGERSDLDLGDLDGEFFAHDWSSDGAIVLLSRVHQARQTLYLYDLGTGELMPVDHPGGWYQGLMIAPDGAILASWQDATHPRQVIRLEPAAGSTRSLLSAGDVPRAWPWTSVSFPGANGDAIQGWLAVPEGEGPFPTILDTHGGPTAVTMETYSPGAQMWLDHGFAYLTINYHGSTTFGKAFQESLIGRIGELEMGDLAGARDYVVENGIADPKRILLTGWSYGGYLTLSGLARLPDLWAGGMAGIPVADWPMCHEDSAETLKGYDEGLFGGRLEQVRDRYVQASPLTYIEAIQAPVLIIQGRNDTRCPARQVEVFEERMRALGKPLDVVWFDAGHGSLVVEQTIQHYEAILRFGLKTAKRTTN